MATQASIIQLQDNAEKKLYPVTSSAAVGMSDGSGSLDEKLKTLDGITSGENLKTINSESILGKGDIKTVGKYHVDDTGIKGEVFNDYDNTNAPGLYSHAEGSFTVSGGTSSHSEGSATQANGHSSHSEGHLSEAKGKSSHAEGGGTIAEGSQSHAEGTYSKSIGLSAHAEGGYTEAHGRASHAEGDRSKSIGDSSHSEGIETTATGSGSHAEGNKTEAIGPVSHAEGYGTIAVDYQSHAEGYGTIAISSKSHAEGQFSVAYGLMSHAEGVGSQITRSEIITNVTETGFDSDQRHKPYEILYIDDKYYLITEIKDKTATLDKNPEFVAGTHQVKVITGGAIGTASHVEGGRNYHQDGENKDNPNYAVGISSHAEGHSTKAIGHYSHAEGTGTKAQGTSSHAEGIQTEAIGKNSHAEGSETKTTGNQAHAEGFITVASADCSHAEGTSSHAEGANSHAEGNRSTAYGANSHAEGDNTASRGFCSHAEGFKSEASGMQSHAGGVSSIASGVNSFSHGNQTEATHDNSIAFGNKSKSINNGAFATGRSTIASGERSFTAGDHTVAEYAQQFSIGSYNTEANEPPLVDPDGHMPFEPDKTLFSIGNGMGEGPERSDALKMLGNGTMWISGVGGFTGKNPTETNSLQYTLLNIGGTPIINHGVSDSTYELIPNVYHIWGGARSLNLTLPTTQTSFLDVFAFEFESKTTPTKLTLPTSVKWVNGGTPVISPNKKYQVTIVNNVAAIGETNV